MPRAALRATLTYRLLPSLTVGVEYNPRVNEVGPLVNWVALTETGTRPALIVGTSSDRIGTPDGRAYFATVSKDLAEATGVPLAPYAGVSYGTHEERLRPIGGLTVRLSSALSATAIFDGVDVHPAVVASFGRHVVTALLVRARDPGLSYSVSF